MDAGNLNNEAFDEKQSLRLINEMIQVSQKKLKNDGILFIIWGWCMFLTYSFSFIQGITHFSHRVGKLISSVNTLLGIGAILFTIYYILNQRKKVQTYISISLRYVWGSLFIGLVLINLIQFNVLHKINFELQHPIFMVLIAFATVITGGILRHKLIVAGGIIFGILAYISSHLLLNNQLLLEAIAWLIAFIIPGHLLYSRRKN